MFKFTARAAAAGIAASALALAGSAAANAAARPDATNACGASCIDVSFVVPGTSGIPESATLAGNANSFVNLDQGSSGNPQEDFSPIAESTVAPLWCKPSGARQSGSVFTSAQCAGLKNAGLLGATTFEFNYNPDNGGSNECVGDWHGQTPVPAGYRFRLTPCGASAASVVVVTNHLPGATSKPGTVWVISGGSNNFSRPIVAGDTGSSTLPQHLTWQQVTINGGKGVSTQEVVASPGAF